MQHLRLGFGLRPALTAANRVFWAGMALCLLLTLFVDIAVLVVPIYDMQLYDRVIQSHNLDSVVFLSLICLVGVVMYGVLDMLRSAALLAIADGIASRLHAPLLQHSIALSLGGVKNGSLDAMRDISMLRGFLVQVLDSAAGRHMRAFAAVRVVHATPGLWVSGRLWRLIFDFSECAW